MKVYKKVPRSEVTGKVISVRWVDINKGDEVNPNYRSRLVAREINTHANPEMFAATPRTEALKLMIAIAATKNAKGQKRRFMVNDVSRAYFYAKAIRKVFVEIAEEDREPGDENMVGELQYSMYGTRDAAQNWEEAYSDFMVSVGFAKGLCSPCVFYHKEKNLRFNQKKNLVNIPTSLSRALGAVQMQWVFSIPLLKKQKPN